MAAQGWATCDYLHVFPYKIHLEGQIWDFFGRPHVIGARVHPADFANFLEFRESIQKTCRITTKIQLEIDRYVPL